MDTRPNTHQKAFELNLDNSRYGTIAEIGAGQEVARWLFRVGGASGTVAKTMSAYDMKFSDAIYGAGNRYVSRERLREMLNHEYALLEERLAEERGADSKFFVYAGTVAATSYSRRTDGHGWIGVKFQNAPNTPPNEVLVHLRLLDEENIAQQEALGEAGINLLWATSFHADNPDVILDALTDSLSNRRIEIDVVLFEGPDYDKSVDNRLINLRLVEKGMTQAVLFSPEGKVWHASEWLYKRPILLERGRFRPVTNINLEMLASAREAFVREQEVDDSQVLEIMEISMNNLLAEGELDKQDFLARMDILTALGKTVMVSNLGEFYRLGAHISRYCKAPVGFVLGVALLQEILDEKYYTSLDGGILESFGRLFKSGVRLYIFPALTDDGGQLSAGNLEAPGHLGHLYHHLLDNRLIQPISTDNPKPIALTSERLADCIRNGDSYWKTRVTPLVADMIQAKGYWGAKKD